MATMKDILAARKQQKAHQGPTDTPNGSGAVPTSAVDPGTTQPPSRPPEPSPAPGGTVKYSCGHKVGLIYLRGSLCPGCQAQRRREQQAACEAKLAHRRRLPDGARFEVTFDAGRTCWSGTLTVGEPAHP